MQRILASRLEGQSKGYGVTIILGEETATAVENDLFNIELDSIAVKGKKGFCSYLYCTR